jgi:hypothetical protein
MMESMSQSDLKAFAEVGKKMPSLVVKTETCVVTEEQFHDFCESAIGTTKPKNSKFICVSVTRDKSWVDPHGVVVCVWFLGLAMEKQGKKKS